MNEAPAVSDDEQDKEFDTKEEKRTKTQVDTEQDTEYKWFNNNNDFFEDGNKSDDDEDDTPYVKFSTRVRHRPNNLIPKTEGVSVPYEEGAVNLQVEYMSNITMEIENNNTVDDVIHAYMLQLSIKADLNRFGNKGEEAAQKEMQQIHETSTFKPILAKYLSKEELKLALS